MIMKPNRDWLTMSEAARQLGVSRQRMHQIIVESNAKTLAINPRMTVIDRKTLEKIERKRKSENSA